MSDRNEPLNNNAIVFGAGCTGRGDRRKGTDCRNIARIDKLIIWDMSL